MRKLLPILIMLPLLVACPGTPAPAVNQAPTASFRFSVSDLTVTFDGAASSDPDGAVVNHAWSFGEGTVNGRGWYGLQAVPTALWMTAPDVQLNLALV